MKDTRGPSGLDRRDFLKAALVAGGGILFATSVPAVSADQGSSTVVLPTVFNQHTTGGTTSVQVTNLGGVRDTITIAFTPANSVRGSAPTYVRKMAIAANGSLSFSMRNFLDIAAGLYGPLQISSTSQKVTAVATTAK